MKVFHHVQSLDRSQGGLAVAVADLCSAMASQDCDVTLGIAGEDEWPVQLSDEVGLISLGVVNSASSHFMLAPAFEPVENYDLVHQHGIWTRSMRVVAGFIEREGVPLIVSPHGMLEPWSLQQHSLRKQIAWRWYQRDILEAARAFHATCEAEAEHIRALGFSQPIAVIPNGISSDLKLPVPEETTERTVAFLSRIHPKKGLNLLLDAWSEIGGDGWTLKIYGDGDPGYMAKVKRLITKLNLSHTVEMCGPVYEDAKWRALEEANLFVLPSYSENFGIVVAEALKAGTPVITTTTTPWQLVETSGCGWCVEPTVEGVAGALRDALLHTSVRELAAMGQRGAKLIDEEFSYREISEKMKAFYSWITEDSEKPGFVVD